MEIRRQRETSQEDGPDSVTGQANNPLAKAVARLDELERNIKYLRSLSSYSLITKPVLMSGLFQLKKKCSASLSSQPCGSS